MPVDLSQIDLNLLVVLDVLLEERHVTRAAKRLHRTQSATSHALARLREQLGDPILVRVGGEMQVTPRAQRLAPELRRLLHSICRALNDDEGWDPATSERIFTLVGPDFASILLPPFFVESSKEAPRVSMELKAPSRNPWLDVVEGRHDLMLAPLNASVTEALLHKEPIGTMSWAVFAREGHPALDDWNLEAWLAYPHIQIRTASNAEGPVDALLKDMKLSRKRGPTLPHFLLAPALLADTDFLLTVPNTILRHAAPRYELKQLPCPLPLPAIELALFSSTQYQKDPAIQWFRHTVSHVAKRIFQNETAH